MRLYNRTLYRTARATVSVAWRRLVPASSLRKGDVVVVEADCLYSNTGEGLHRFVDPVDGEVYLYSQFETADAKRMFACFDQPDLKARYTLTVTAPASWGAVAGTVRSLGRCEAAPEVLAGETVRIVAADGGEMATVTAADGSYRYWLEAARGPFTVQVAADGHVARADEVVIAAGQETTLDIDARLAAACIVADPVELQAGVAAGEQTAQAFDLLNLGAVAGDFAARVGGDPSDPGFLDRVPAFAFFDTGEFNNGDYVETKRPDDQAIYSLTWTQDLPWATLTTASTSFAAS